MPDPVVIPIIIEKGRQIVRARRNEDDPLFTKVSDISYPSENKKNTQGRIGYEKPLFFGVYVDKKWDWDKPTFSAIREILPEYLDYIIWVPEFVTLGYWENNQQLLCYTLPIPPTYKGEEHVIIREIVNLWTQHRGDFPIEDIELVEYIGELMTANGDVSYNITASFTNFIFEKRPKIQGIIYPSVKSKGLNMCVAIRSDVVDKSLQCNLAKMFTYIKTTPKEHKILTMLEAKVNEDNTLEWRYIT